MSAPTLNFTSECFKWQLLELWCLVPGPTTPSSWFTWHIFFGRLVKSLFFQCWSNILCFHFEYMWHISSSFNNKETAWRLCSAGEASSWIWWLWVEGVWAWAPWIHLKHKLYIDGHISSKMFSDGNLTIYSLVDMHMTGKERKQIKTSCGPTQLLFPPGCFTSWHRFGIMLLWINIEYDCVWCRWASLVLIFLYDFRLKFLSNIYLCF